MSTGLNKRRQIVDAMRSRIRSGTFRPGDRIPSDSELVREFGVSRPTVAKALQELQECGLVQRKAGSGTYVLQNDTDRGIQFGLLIPGLGTTEIFEPICAQMACAAQDTGHSIVWGANVKRLNFGEEAEIALELCQRYIRSKVGGVFFAPLEHVPGQQSINERIVGMFQQANIPVVLLDRDFLPYPQRSNFDLVGVDNRRVGYMITHHLFQQGCKRVIFVARPDSASTIDARIAGFMEAVVKDSGEFSSKLLHRCDPSDQQCVAEIMTNLKPDGVVCGNDVTAGRLMHCLDQLNIDVPGDVKVAGIDDVKYAELLRVPLTTVRQPCAAIGEVAFRTMLERVALPEVPARDVLLGCNLIVRESTK
jgi:GntR family transcriptional regulator, arabinose operon transcriptional repressor